MKKNPPKAYLSAVVNDRLRGRPRVVNRHDRSEAVLMSREERKRLSQARSFGRLLMAAPLEKGDSPQRSRKPLRDTSF